MDKRGDPTYIRLSLSNRQGVKLLTEKFGNINASEVIDWLVGLGLDTYEFHMNHFATFPVGLKFIARRDESQEEDG